MLSLKWGDKTNISIPKSTGLYLDDSSLMNILEEVAECRLHVGEIILMDMGLELHYCKIFIR